MFMSCFIDNINVLDVVYTSFLTFLPSFLYSQVWMRSPRHRKVVASNADISQDVSFQSAYDCLDLTTAKLLLIHEAVGVENSRQKVIDNTISAAYKLLPVEIVNLVMITRDTDGQLLTSDSFQPEIDHSRGIAAVVAATGRTYSSNDIVTDDRYPMGYSNVMCAAVKSDNGEVIGVITVFNKTNGQGGISPFNHDDQSLLESITSNASVALFKSSLYEESLREKRKYAALVPVIRARTCPHSLDIILREIVMVVCQLLSSDSVSIFLVDHENREAIICASSGNLDGYTVAFGQGAAGTVAAFCKSVLITNADRNSRLNAEVDNFGGLVTQTIMCVPVPGFKVKTAAAAVIQCINKKDGSNFDLHDEDALEHVCVELSNVLRSKAIELQELRSSTSNLSRKDYTDSTLQTSLLSEYGTVRHKAPTISPSMSRSTSSGLLNTLSLNPLTRLRGLDMNSVDVMSAEVVSKHLSCHDTDPFELDDMTLIYLAKHMLNAYGLEERFNLDPDKLRVFLIAVHNNYHTNNSFHNYKHAWGTMHLTFQILCGGAALHLTSLDILALLVAAICHDLDHPGNNNAFEVATRSVLAERYCDDSVLERHHCCTALRLLSMPEHDFIEKLLPADKTHLRRLITASIMATDMSQHFSLVDQLISHSLRPLPFSKKLTEERICLARLVLHAADIGAQTQKRGLALKWTNRCLDEFSSQGAKEKLLELELTPFMQGLDDELTRMQLQVGFVGGIVVPLWTALAACFPKLEFAANQAVSSKNYYADQVSAIIDKRKNNSNNA